MGYGIKIDGKDSAGADFYVIDSDTASTEFLGVSNGGLYTDASDGRSSITTASIASPTSVTGWDNTQSTAKQFLFARPADSGAELLFNGSTQALVPCEYVIVSPISNTTYLGSNVNGTYGVQVKNSSGNLIFDSRKVKKGDIHKAVIVSLVSAAAAIVITMFVLHQNNVEPNKVANESIENEGLLSVTMIENDVQGNINKSQWVSRMNHSNPVDLSQKFRYTEPFESDLISENTINFEGYEFKNPARLENRISIFPANIGSKSYEELRKGILAGTLPNNKKINVGELINAFGHNYSKPSSGEAFAIDSEFIYSPWSSEKCLLRIGVSVADRDNPKSNEKLLLSNVKMSVEFNPDMVSGYRLIGESDLDVNLSVERLDQDVLLAGQTVTVLYEVIPINTKQVANEKTSEIVSVSIDYKDPFDGKNKSMLSRVLVDGIKPIEKSSDDIRFAASVLGYGMILEERHDLTEATYDLVSVSYTHLTLPTKA